MTIYWLMFAIPALAALSTIKCQRQVTSLGWFLLATVFVLLIGLRHEVGVDWFNSLQVFKQFQDDLFLNILRRVKFDPVYTVLLWSSNQMGLGIYGANLLSAVPLVCGVFVFCHRQPYPWIALVVAIPFLIIVIGMGYSRQAAAIGFMLLALLSLTEGYLWRFVCLLVLGALFHPTVLIFVPLGLVARSSRSFLNFKNLWVWLWVSSVGFLLYHYLLSNYLETLMGYFFGVKMVSGGAIIRTLMNALPATIFLLFRKRFHLDLVESRLWGWVSIVSIICVALTMLLPSSSAVDRVSWYLIPIQLFVYSRIPLLVKSGYSRQTLTFLIIIAYAMVQLVFLNFGTHASGWLPYKFYPLEVLF